ncbi:class I SAM-dependent methyltransferase [Chromatiaceae bacterium AAb-1]|nr:class I SAM-dependent methyltransferase [Chromatiaceae bacterium AAb-1]
MSIDFYNKNAGQFAAATLTVDMASLYNEFLPLLPSGCCILDVGCGTGRDSRYFLSQGFTVVAFDASSEMARLATELTGLQVKHTDFLSFSTTKPFEGIWACASLLHVPATELSQTLTHLAAQLTSTGIFYCSFKYGEVDIERDGRHFTNMTTERLTSLLYDTNLCILKSWITDDVRPERSSDKWLNALLLKEHP